MVEYAEPRSDDAGMSGDRSSNCSTLPDYSYIVKEMRAGRVIPFLGAGASVLHRSVDCEGERETALLAGPNELHKLLCDIAKKGNRLLIVATAYPDAIERAFEEENVPFHLVISAYSNRDPEHKIGTVKYRGPRDASTRSVSSNRLDISLHDASIIYEIDDVELSLLAGYLIDHRYYFSIVPPAIAVLLKRKGFLFIGYSLQDWAIRDALDIKRSLGTKERSVAIPGRLNINLVEKNVFAEKGVDVYGIDLMDFVKELSTYYFCGMSQKA